MKRYHVFGDTGGHLRQLKSGLEAIGLNRATYKLPEDITVIHCGDLLHKGPNSAGVIYMVDRIMQQNPGQWIQLLGNHEYQYLNGVPFWREKIDPDAIQLLTKWKEAGLARNAFCIDKPAQFASFESMRRFVAPNKPILLTHAGLTKEYWDLFLKQETDLVKLTARLNSFSPKQVGKTGLMIGGVNTPTDPAGPIWAHSAREVWYSWHSEPTIPFTQIHGHTNAFLFEQQRWWGGTPKQFIQNSRTHPASRSVVTQMGDSIIVAIDPGYEKTAPPGPQPSLSIIAQ